MKLQEKKRKRSAKVHHKINAIVFHKVVNFFYLDAMRAYLPTVGQTDGRGNVPGN